METTDHPIHRSSELRSLSHDHHQGLVFVSRIKQGVVYDVPEQTIGEYCKWFWENHMQRHMKKEELALCQIFSNSHPLLNNMIEDHEAIRTKMEEVIDGPSYFSIQRLAQIIYYHIRFEERVLFPAVEKIASPQQLKILAALLVDDETPAKEWPDKFWIKSAVRTAA